MSHVLCVKEGWPTCRRHKGNVVSIIPGKIRREGSSFPLRETVAVLLLYVGHLWLFGYSPALAQLSPLPRAVHLSSVSPFPIFTLSNIQFQTWLIQAMLCTALHVDDVAVEIPSKKFGIGLAFNSHCMLIICSCSLELISLAYQPWYSVFLSRQISEQYFSA